MNITLSQWLQIAAIAVSAAISISRWVWDARKDRKTIKDIQNMSEANEQKARPRTPIATRLAFFLPLAILFWQMFTPGELTRFEFGTMLLASMTFLGFIVLGLRDSFSSLLDSDYYSAKIYHKVLVGQMEQNTLMAEAMKSHREAVNILRQKEEAEQGAAEQPLLAPLSQ